MIRNSRNVETKPVVTLEECSKVKKSKWIITVNDGYVAYPYEVEIPSIFSIQIVITLIKSLFRSM